MSCAGCGRLVVSGVIITALDKKWHDHCFRCGLCAKQLAGSFFGHDGLPFCEDCIDDAEAGKARPSAGPPPEASPTLARAAAPPPQAPAAAPHDEPAPTSRPSVHYDDHDLCRRCKDSIVSGSIVNALEGSFHEACFVCCDPACATPLDTFYGCQGLPYCPDHIDAAEDRMAAGIPPPSFSRTPSIAAAAMPPAPSLASLSVRSNDVDEYPSSFAEPPSSASLASAAAPSISPSLPASGSAGMWEDLARRADARAEQLEEKLKHIKLALAEERRTAGHEYTEMQRELEAERARSSKLQLRVDQLEAQVAKLSAGGGTDVSETIAKLHKMEKENLEMHTALERLQLELRDANERAASAVAMDFASDVGGGGGGAPPPPPPPPGAPPPPPPMSVVNPAPLKITRTGQGDKMSAATAAAEANPQADLINELKKGRPALRRTAAQRPSKRDILTRNANARAAQEPSRPDPSVVKGADTGNEYARNMASNAEKSAGLAVERDNRVATGNLRMRQHRNKYLDSLLDQIK